MNIVLHFVADQSRSMLAAMFVIQCCPEQIMVESKHAWNALQGALPGGRQLKVHPAPAASLTAPPLQGLRAALALFFV